MLIQKSAPFINSIGIRTVFEVGSISCLAAEICTAACFNCSYYVFASKQVDLWSRLKFFETYYMLIRYLSSIWPSLDIDFSKSITVYV